MKFFNLLLLILFFISTQGQNKVDSLRLDSSFLEDQVYLGVTYNFLVNQPNDDVGQRNLSYGLQAGFIKDIPLSKDRNVALGLGLGYAINTYYSNLRATEIGSDIEYSIVSSKDYKRNKLESHLIEMPLEFRWRNATPSNYKFWRIYAGFKLGYVVSSRSKIVSDLGDDSFYNKDTEKLVYGLTFSLGYNTFNFHAYYGLNSLFKDNVLINGDPILMRPLRIGLIFYIL
ncbi:porin family protein [uncultured Maribacter sp.]|uniref:porin family protein n=1 Tax=uncultured Maribacter sp. TaxID=431308 RepID=UPI00260C355B|nr:porin family protein [uncultured Maribacter sp.]